MNCDKRIRPKRTDPRQVNLLNFDGKRTCNTEMVELGNLGWACHNPGCGASWLVCLSCETKYRNMALHFENFPDCALTKGTDRTER